MATEFAPAERAPKETIQRQHDTLMELPFMREFLDATPNMTVVLNAHRQIVFANRAFTEYVGAGMADGLPGAGHRDALDDNAGVLGRRVGEAFGCIRSTLMDAGCGTSVFCQTCGAANAIVNSQRTHTPDVQECRMFTGEGVTETALDLRVWATPVDVLGETLTVFSLMDISAEKRRGTLERIFFHDVLNTAGGVKGLADLLVHGDVPQDGIPEMAGMLSECADQLVGEISAQRMLTAAESGDLQVSAIPMHALDLLTSVLHQFHGHALATDRTITIDASAEAVEFSTDPVLVRRVLINLVKNALEATAAPGTVTLGAAAAADGVSLTVHNAAAMPMDVQRQMFMRSFSTKGGGRGLGTYSIKLISERYLHGAVSFTSSEEEGTRFTVRLPRSV